MNERVPAKWIEVYGVKVYASFTEISGGRWQGRVAQFGAGAEADDYATCERMLWHNVVSAVEDWLQKAVSGRDSDREALLAEKKADESAKAPKPAEAAPEPPAESLDKPAEGRKKGGGRKKKKLESLPLGSCVDDGGSPC